MYCFGRLHNPTEYSVESPFDDDFRVFVGCLLGIKNGLSGINRGADFRTPVADRIYLPTADGGRAITDAATVTYELVNSARAMQGLRPLAPNNGMQYHFALPGSLQGFVPEDSSESRGTTHLRTWC